MAKRIPPDYLDEDSASDRAAVYRTRWSMDLKLELDKSFSMLEAKCTTDDEIRMFTNIKSSWYSHDLTDWDFAD